MNFNATNNDQSVNQTIPLELINNATTTNPTNQTTTQIQDNSQALVVPTNEGSSLRTALEFTSFGLKSLSKAFSHIGQEDFTHFFKDEDNCKIADDLIIFLKGSKWDLTYYMDRPLSFLLYSKVMEAICAYEKKNKLSPEQKEALYSVLAAISQKVTNLNEAEEFSKKISGLYSLFKKSEEQRNFFLLDKMCTNHRAILSSLTLSEIFNKTKNSTEVQSVKPKICLSDLSMHHQAIIFIDSSFPYLINELKRLRTNNDYYIQDVTALDAGNKKKKSGTRTNPHGDEQKKQEIDPRFTDLFKFQKLIDGIIYLHNTYAKDILRNWNELSLTAENASQQQRIIQSLKEHTTRYQRFIGIKIDLLQKLIKTYHDAIKLLLPIEEKKNKGNHLPFRPTNNLLETSPTNNLFETSQPLLKLIENLNTREAREEDQMAMQMFSTMAKLNQAVQELNNGAFSLLDTVQDLKRKEATELQKYLKNKSVKETETLMELAPGVVKVWSDLMNKLDNLQKMLKGHVEIMVPDLDLFSANFSITEPDIDLSWCDDDRSIKLKKKPVQAVVKESVVDEVVDDEEELPQVKIFKEKSPEEVLEQDLNTAITMFKQQKLGEVGSSLKGIHLFTGHLKLALGSIPQDLSFRELGKVTKREYDSHLSLFGTELDLFIQALTTNNFEALFEHVSNLYQNIHTVLEKLIQEEYYKKHGTFFFDSHRLTDPLKSSTIWKNLDAPVDSLSKAINGATVWVRYLNAYQTINPKEESRPEILNDLIFFKELSFSLRESPLKLDEKRIDRLKKLTDTLFCLSQDMYTCLFKYIEVSKGKPLHQKTIDSWMAFLKMANSALQDHLAKQLGTTVKPIKGACQPIVNTLGEIKKAKDKCQLTKTLEVGNPYIPLGDLENWVEKLLIAMTQMQKYQRGIYTPSLFQSILRSTQKAVEESLKIRCLSNGMPLLDSHDFRAYHRLLQANNDIINENSSSLKLKSDKVIDTSNEMSLKFNGGSAINYPFLFSDRDVEWLNCLRTILQQFPEYLQDIDSQRNSHDEEDLTKIMEEAIKVVVKQADVALQDLFSAQSRQQKK